MGFKLSQNLIIYFVFINHQQKIFMKKFFSLTRSIFFFLFLFAAYVVHAQTIYITLLGAGNQSGSSWDNAAPGPQLQDKINNAASGSQVWVAAGTYTPGSYPYNCRNCGTDTRHYSFSLRNGVALYGGFAGTEITTSQRNISSNVTNLSGDIGLKGDSTDNCYHTILSIGNDNTAILDGFTCTGGNANGGGIEYINNAYTYRNAGGGMYNINSSPRIINCSFWRNNAAGANGGVVGSDGEGAGMFNDNSSPQVIDCSFTENTTASGNGSTGGGNSSGTGMYNNNSSPQVINCSFIGNKATSGSGGTGGGGCYGTGMYNSSSSPQVTNCKFIRNMATSGSGGTSGGTSSGTGMYNYNSSAEIKNCYFIENKATGGNSDRFGGSSLGAGIYNASDKFSMSKTSTRIINCAFLYNIAAPGSGELKSGSAYGGGLCNIDSSTAQVINCTFTKNRAGYGGGMYIGYESSANVTNSIIYGNSANSNANFGYSNATSIAVNYSLIEGGFGGNFTGNIDTDPLFINPADADGADNIFGTADDGLNLSCASPAINKGDNNAIGGTNTDITGNDRIQHSTVDMGAYESSYDVPLIPSVSLSENPGNTICAGTIVTFTATPVDGGSTPVYEWKKNGVIIKNNSAVYTTNELADGDSISVQLTTSETCISATTASDGVKIRVNAVPDKPVITANGATTFCEGNNVTLSARNSYTSYKWNNGEITKSITAVQRGSYSVMVTNENGCSSSSEAVEITVNSIPSAPVVRVADDCGFSTLSTNATGNLLWNTGETTPSITVSNAASYTVTQTVNGCTSTLGSGTAAPKAAPVKPVVTANGATNFFPVGSVTLSAPSGLTAYNWSNNATTQSITVNQSGSYSVVVTNADGCSSPASDPITVSVNIDTQKPVIICPLPVTLCYNVTQTYAIASLQATDNCSIASISYAISGATTRTGSGVNAGGKFNPGTSTITWTVTDGSNNTATCQTVVVVNPAITVSIPDAKVLSNGVDINTMYIGYAPAAAITLTAAVSGGSSNYTYKWSTGATTASIKISPAAATTYKVTVIDASGCLAIASKVIKVVNVACGSKVNVCHGGNILCINSKDVASHLAHGDYLGGCKTGSISSRAIDNKISSETFSKSLTVKASPNPSANYFTLHISSPNLKDKVTVTIMDALGRVVEVKTAAATTALQIGNIYRPGVYYAQAMQGSEKVTVKLIKQSE